MQRLKHNKYKFFIEDKKTLERVLEDMKDLLQGIWLQRTPLGSTFYYKIICIKNKFTKRKYIVEFADYSGEYFNDLCEKNNWTHNNSYFKYVKTCDILFFMINISDKLYYQNIYSDYIAVLNLLASSSTDSNQIDKPVCLIFLQSDRIGQNDDIISEEKILDDFSRLIQLFELKCRLFSFYFVSSVGIEAEKFSYPIDRIPKKVKHSSKNVIEPLIWGLLNLNTIYA